jgi:hypothetical protein
MPGMSVVLARLRCNVTLFLRLDCVLNIRYSCRAYAHLDQCCQVRPIFDTAVSPLDVGDPCLVKVEERDKIPQPVRGSKRGTLGSQMLSRCLGK